MAKTLKLATIRTDGTLEQIATDDEITAVLEQAAGRAKANTIQRTSTLTLIAECDFARQLVHADTTIKERAGATFGYTDGGPSANAYKYKMTVTTFTLRIGSDGKTIYLDDVDKVVVLPKTPVKEDIELTAAAHASWLDRQSKRFAIRQPAVLAVAA
jgi:hypothetical protein